MTPPALTELSKTLFSLNDEPSKEGKVEVLRRSIKTRDSIQALLWHLMLSKFITFGVDTKCLDRAGWQIHQDTILPGLTPTDDGLILLLQALQTRSISGHRALHNIFWFSDQLDDAGPRGAFFAILQKKVRAGIGIKLLNEAFPGLVGDFKVAKACSWKDYSARDHILVVLKTCGLIAERKLNGEHMLYVKNSYDPFGTLIGESGRPYLQFPYLARWLHSFVPDGIVLDGEIAVEGNAATNFDIATYTRSNKVWENFEIPVRFIVWDAIPHAEWLSHDGVTPQHVRTTWVQETQWGANNPARAVESWRITTEAEADRLYAQALDLGQEGVVYKDPRAPYSFKRGKNWVKRKPEETKDLKIVGLRPGEIGSKFANTLGAIEVLLPDGKTQPVSCGKLTVAERNAVWAEPQNYIGKVVEVAYDASISTTGFTPDGFLYQPRVKRLRHDK